MNNDLGEQASTEKLDLLGCYCYKKMLLGQTIPLFGKLDCQGECRLWQIGIRPPQGCWPALGHVSFNLMFQFDNKVALQTARGKLVSGLPRVPGQTRAMLGMVLGRVLGRILRRMLGRGEKPS